MIHSLIILCATLNLILDNFVIDLQRLEKFQIAIFKVKLYITLVNLITKQFCNIMVLDLAQWFSDLLKICDFKIFQVVANL